VSGGGLRSRVRRRTLALLGAGVPASAALACAPAPPPDRRVRLPLASLPQGGRAEVEYAGEPTEVARTEAGVAARSLLCSHFGCRVEWRPAERRYHCPCHEGLFDAEGSPVAGPPNRPLRRVRAEVSGAFIQLGEP
jgi:nitrite reductase/ring-hydroxylating ferredoxin subunit